MSPVPPEPKPSNLPPSVASDNQTATPSDTTSTSTSTFPTPKLRLELRDLSHQSNDVFLKNFNSAKDFAFLVSKVLNLLYTSSTSSTTTTTSASASSSSSSSGAFASASTTTRPSPPKIHIPQTRSVTLILRDMPGVAYTTGIDLDPLHKEIHLSLQYLTHVSTLSSPRQELLGVICHELVHCFQWDARGSAPGGLIEGIADWVRLNAGYVPPHWKREAGGDWDAGYQTTGYFLEWLDKTRGRGSVVKLNQKLEGEEYKEVGFWKGLFGKEVGELWEEYRESLKKEKKVEGYGDAGLKMEVRVRKDEE